MLLKDGEAVRQYIQTQDFTSLEPQSGRLRGLSQINKVVLFGSSASGKSTIEKGLRIAASGILEGKISVPKRVVTRSPRTDDVDLAYCSEEEFAARVAHGEFGMYGSKLMEGGRVEPFGFTRPDEGAFPVYPANNMVVKNPERIRPTAFLEGALLVVIYAPDAIREKRMRRRSPELFRDRPEEAVFRLSAGESSDLMREAAHVAVNNYGNYESRSGKDIVDFLSELVSSSP